MTLQIGTQLGSYEILAPIGAGGMGEVYRARDTKLKRDVAIKVLPEEMSNDRASSDFGAKRKFWPRSIIPTSRKSTVWKIPAARCVWCWNWSKAKRWPID